jgi:hypothetical protein
MISLFVNAVCQARGIASRAYPRLEPAFGGDFMRQRRPMKDHRELTNGQPNSAQRWTSTGD